MKRRRRLNTQTIQRKKTTQTQRRPAPAPSGKIWTFIKGLLLIGIIVGIGYAGYKYLIPVLQQKLPSLRIEKQTLPKEEPLPQKENVPLPVEKPVEEETTTKSQAEAQSEVVVEKTQIEILNGCGEQGIAKTLADKLKATEYDVINTGNYLKHGKRYWEVKKTQIIDRLNTKDSRKKSLELAKIMGVSSKNVKTVVTSNPIADITIVVGKDYKKLPIFKRKK